MTYQDLLNAVTGNELKVKENVSEFKYRLADVKENKVATGRKEAKASGGRYTETLYSNSLGSRIQSLAFVLGYVAKPVDAFTYLSNLNELDAKHTGFFLMIATTVKRFAKDAFGFTANLTPEQVFELVVAFATVRTGKEVKCKVTDNKAAIELEAKAVNDALIEQAAAAA